ncbi:CaiB/BaiF CoA-transferase family protein [Caballeronia novacaledonica]|uniref:CoA transferase n=1 Tax=Caballeronia novacaledonica TaxID=1544861 RepID=A0AA37MHM1_9BURK|nr:CoA transferase [Caballeronia novacaledonica]GJH27030.1 CoA transferase [Caballeronia novacaledonica]
MTKFDDLPPPGEGAALRLLEGTRVLDLTTSVSGPYTTLLLADLGATVVKIEQPGQGDDVRAWGPPFLDGESLWFLSVNRNKQSLTLDYGKREGLDVLKRMVAHADVVVVNKTASVQRKLGVDYESLKAVNARLIHASISGFGLQGARSELPCYDLIAEGYSGVMDLTGESEGEPQKVGTPAADLLSGADAALAVLAALIDRNRTGQGHCIDVSMIESMTRFMTPRIVPYLGSGELPRRSGGRDSVIAVYQVFQAADAPLTIGLGNDGIWNRFWAALGEPETAQEVCYASNSDRRRLRKEIVAKIQAILSTKDRDHWLRVFRDARIPAGPINRIDEVAGDEELRSRGFFYSAPFGETHIPQVGLGIHVDGNARTFRKAPPRLGEDSERVLRTWLDMDAEEYDRLRRDGVT